LEVGSDPTEIRRELRSFFASGTCLQELYVTPSVMTDENWDDLAECARWAHARTDVLVDTHWIGGNPAHGEPYGWASWSEPRGVLALRNPGSETNRISLDIGQAFELPIGHQSAFDLRSPWRSDRSREGFRLLPGKPHVFQLQPLEVLVFDAVPVPSTNAQSN
jgi:hypothetical protein